MPTDCMYLAVQAAAYRHIPLPPENTYVRTYVGRALPAHTPAQYTSRGIHVTKLLGIGYASLWKPLEEVEEAQERGDEEVVPHTMQSFSARLLELAK